MKRAAFIGLGVMGGPMAGHLAQKTDLEVTVYNRTAAKAADWTKKYKGRAAATPVEAADGADIIFTCVGNDDDLRGILGPLETNAIIVDHTTTSATVAREMHDLFKGRFIDAPVSGGQAGAEKGQLTVMAGGDKSLFDQIEPILRQAYAKEARWLGPSGAGQLAKMINQICIAGTLQGLSEGLAFGLKAGLNMDEVLAVISKGAAQSWQMDNRGATMIRDQFDFGFAVDWMVKDLGIAIDEARRNGSSLAVTEEILGFYRELQAKGCNRMDTSSLIKRLR